MQYNAAFEALKKSKKEKKPDANLVSRVFE